MVQATAASVADKVVDKSAAIADKVIDRTGDFVSAAADKASNIFEAAANIMSHAVDQYGAKVVDAVLWVVRVDALQTLVIGWLCFFVAVAIAVFVWTGFSRREWKDRWNQMSDGENFIHLLIGAATTVVFAITLSTALPRVADVWLYTAVIKPELYLAKQAVDIVKAKLMPTKQPCQR